MVSKFTHLVLLLYHLRMVVGSASYPFHRSAIAEHTAVSYPQNAPPNYRRFSTDSLITEWMPKFTHYQTI